MNAQAMTPSSTRIDDAESRWSLLQEESHLPDVQDMIRSAIRRGAIRVVPDGSGRILVIPRADPTPARRDHEV